MDKNTKYLWFNTFLQNTDFEEEKPKLIQMQDKRLCVIKKNDQIFAVENKCPHAGGSLASGHCEGDFIVCPIHRFKYNIETGRGIDKQGDFVETYATKWENGVLFIGFAKKKWWQF